MRLCIFEDSGVQWLEPITLTRPAFALWCGAQRLFERHQRQFAVTDAGFWVRPPLLDLWKLEQPASPVNDVAWLRAGPTVWSNGRWLPAPDMHIDPALPHAGIVNEQIAYLVIPGGETPDTPTLDDWLNGWRQRLPNRNVGGTMLDFLWDVVDQNGAALMHDDNWFHSALGSKPHAATIAVEGPLERCIVAPTARVEPCVFADVRGGPVLIDEGAVVQSFSRLEGPCYIGRGTWVAGAKLRGNTTVGPCCRIGGEVEESVLQGYSNKYHDGFLGHSYLGEWVNIAAGTQTSDLRNDYDVVRVSINGQRRSTGRTKVGSFIGDHAKTGLGALLNTGSTIGAFASLLPSGTLLPQLVPSFCQVRHGQLHDLWDLRSVFSTAARVMQRRGQTLTDTHRDFYHHLFETTMEQRHKVMREGEMRRLRKSV
jgi:UDP-N-acetylglucosamine diphosphorylase/glucosamine-1-phosphate N-acetyltransferase